MTIMRIWNLILSFIFIGLNSYAESRVTIEVRNPENYRIRELMANRILVDIKEGYPERLQFKVPERFVVRKAGVIQIEPTLEKWRMSSRGEEGQPLLRHGPTGKCAYSFGGIVGCDFYPFTNDSGETRYLALRFMARESEKENLEDSDFKYVDRKMKVLGAEEEIYDVFSSIEYDRSTFVEIKPDGTEISIPKAVQLIGSPPKRSDPVTGEPGQSWVKADRGEDYWVNSPDGRLDCSENRGNQFECMMCACHHEAGSKFENGTKSVIGYGGKYAAMATIKTRVAMDGFSNTYCGVVWFQGIDKKTKKPTPHFTWTLDGKKEEPVTGENYKRCYQPVKDVMEELDEHFASHYHTPGVSPGWKCWESDGVTPSAGFEIDGHIFYDTCDRRSRAIPESMSEIRVEQ